MQLNKSRVAGIKKGIEYFYDDYGTCFCDPIDQSGMVGGVHEEGRNELENPQRIERIRSLSAAPMVLDYGCGHGLFVDYLMANGINAIGYDKFTNRNTLPQGFKFDIVVLTEVIEHLQEPFTELDHIFQLLLPTGKVMIETSFTDWLQFEAEYINPDAGHNTVWSHSGLTAMMISKGFIEGEHFNRNVRIYTKP